MLEGDKLLKYLKIILAQAMKSPSDLPELISRTKHFISITKKGEKLRIKKEEQLKIPIPFLCVFSVTWNCNLDCKGCYAMNYSFKEQLPLEKISDTIEECQKLGIYFFIIAGGEPLLIKGIIEKITSFKESFFVFYTNGTLLEPHIKTLKQAKNILPVISVEGKDHYIDLRRGEGVSKKVKKAMYLLKKNHIPFAFSTMITNMNIKYVTSREWLDRQWDQGARFGFFTDYIPFEKNLNRSFILTDQDRIYRERALSLRKKEAKPPIFHLPADEYDGPCQAAGKGMIHINADGYVEPCPYSHFAADNIKDKPIKDILRSEFFSELRKSIKSWDNSKKRMHAVLP